MIRIAVIGWPFGQGSRRLELQASDRGYAAAVQEAIAFLTELLPGAEEHDEHLKGQGISPAQGWR